MDGIRLCCKPVRWTTIWRVASCRPVFRLAAFQVGTGMSSSLIVTVGLWGLVWSAVFLW